MEPRKNNANMYQQRPKISKVDLQMGTHFGTHFGHLASLCCPRQVLGAKMTPKAPQRAPGTSPSLHFHKFWIDFKCILWWFFVLCKLLVAILPTRSYLFGLPWTLFYKILATSSNFLGSPVGSLARCGRRCTARWREGRRQVDKA